jgi:hypothetical protein
VARGATPDGFWRSLVRYCPAVGYVALGSLALNYVRTRLQVRAALDGLLYRHRFLVVDFEGVRSISEAASHELFLEVPRRTTTFVEPINLEPAVSQIISRTIRFGDR